MRALERGRMDGANRANGHTNQKNHPENGYFNVLTISKTSKENSGLNMEENGSESGSHVSEHDPY